MANFDKIIRHIGKHLDTFDDLLDEFLTEIFTRSTRDPDTFADGLIEHWEEDFAIEDPAATLADRQAELNAKVIAVGGDNFEDFDKIAEGLGYNIDSATNPHLRITDGDFPEATCDVSIVDTDIIWDQAEGQSSKTWCVRGTGVEIDTVLQGIFNNMKAIGTSISYINE